MIYMSNGEWGDCVAVKLCIFLPCGPSLEGVCTRGPWRDAEAMFSFAAPTWRVGGVLPLCGVVRKVPGLCTTGAGLLAGVDLAGNLMMRGVVAPVRPWVGVGRAALALREEGVPVGLSGVLKGFGAAVGADVVGVVGRAC